MDVLAKLVEQIEKADFRDEHGHPLKNNAHYIAAKASLESAITFWCMPEGAETKIIWLAWAGEPEIIPPSPKPKLRDPSFRFPPKKR